MLLTSKEPMSKTTYMRIPLKVRIGQNFILIDKADYDSLPSKVLTQSNGYPYMKLKKVEVLNGVRIYWAASVLVSRWLLQCPDEMVVDHINRKPWDNRRCNLRVCTFQENLLNKSKQRDNTSGFRGVLRCPPRADGTLVFRVSLQSKRFEGASFNGSYSDVGVAARVYDREAIRVYGRFASLNFPTEDNTNYEPPKKFVLNTRVPRTGRQGVYQSANGRYYVQAPNGSGRNVTIKTGFLTVKAAHLFRIKYMKERVAN